MSLSEHTYLSLIANNQQADRIATLPDQLLDLWDDDYFQTHPLCQMVTVTLDEHGASFTYLFDLTRQRTIGVVGLPAFVKHKRDANRMAGHPLSQGPKYHRGHLMAHSIGGASDINLVPQLGSLNIGKFRVIERLVRRLAEDNVRCLYFVRTIYPPDTHTSTHLTQLPEQLEQGVVSSGRLIYAIHNNL